MSIIDALVSGWLKAYGPWLFAAALAALRLIGFFVFAPALAGAVPWRFRVGLALLLGGLAASGPAPATAPSIAGWSAAIAEFAMGAATGIGVGLFIAGMRFAGEQLDRQLGLEEAAEPDPFSGGEAQPFGPATRLLGGLAVLTLLFGASATGRMPIVEGLLQTFSRIPPGGARLEDLAGGWLTSALAQSCELSLRVALPLLSALAIVHWAQALAARAAPLAPGSVIAHAVRPLLGLCVLAATFGGVDELAADRLSRWWTAFPRPF
ncbi:MAG: flagellar biosynthetic protein FliR [Planctomyces sp.]|nr:flagellar biosynthetic protein FliR [Planctomyces sp.]